jgi:hypothetical protein
MPLLEGICEDRQCAAYRYKQEHFYHHWDAEPLNPCSICGGPTVRVMSAFNVAFSGVISARYNDRNLENAHQEGHTVWGRDSKGKAFSKKITTFQEQREWCREQKLALPSEMPSNYEVAEDGRTVKSSMGMPGCEI